MDLDLYEKAIKPRTSSWRRVLRGAWTVAGLTALNLAAWAEPFSDWALAWAKSAGVSPLLTDYVGVPLVMALRAILLTEAFGYVYHRFFQHLGVMTRLSGVIRRNQMFHWVHHMVIYPIGGLYRRQQAYVPSETGIAWSWTFPAVLGAAAALAVFGAGLKAVAFIASFALYAAFVIDVTHSRFHEIDHPWDGKRYFQWLEQIHVLHHWDQRYNFTIVHPLMDWLFGTYLSPASHQREIRVALQDHALTVSDLTNWRYLLLEATPAEYAAFISQARRHARSMRKVDLLLELFARRVEARPEDAEARELRRRTVDLVNDVAKQSLAELPVS